MSSEIILIYILKSTVITAIMYAYYRLALKDNKFHYYNRFYLLISLGLSLIVPLLNFHWFTFEKPVAETTSEELLLMMAEPGIQSPANIIAYSDWIFLFIAMIGISLLILLVISILKIYRIKNKSLVQHFEDIEFIETDVENAPFSFLNNLFWKKSIYLYDENGQKIFKHEITHIRQKHSWDRLFCQIIGSLFWINPFNWIIQKEIQTIHEFIADEEAVGENNTEAFAKLLLETHYGTHFLNPIHAFNYSSIKRRLAMLTKSNNTKYSYLRRVMVLPVIIIALGIFSIRVNAVDRVKSLEKQFEDVYFENQIDTIKPKLPAVPEPLMPPTPPIPALPPMPALPASPPLPPLPAMPPIPEVKSFENNDEFYLRIENSKNDKKKPVILINGRIANSTMGLKKNEIATIRVIGEKEAARKYNLYGRTGAIEITTKNDQVKFNQEPAASREVNHMETIEFKGQPLEAGTEKVHINGSISEFKAKKSENEADPKKVSIQEGDIRLIADSISFTPSRGKNNTPDNVVYIVDGKRVENSKLKKVDPGNIQSINVIKGESASKRYSDLNGKSVIEINLKKK